MPQKSIAETDLSRANRIRSAREHLKWSQSDLARALKVSPQTVQQWEKGGGVRSHTQAKLAKALQVSPDWLMFGPAEQTSQATISPLSSEEQLLLLSYRALTPADKQIAVRIISVLSTHGR